MTLDDILQQLGMNNVYKDIYLFCAENNESSMSAIAKHIKKARSSTYHIVYKMIEKGFIHETKTLTHNMYTASTVEQLHGIIISKKKKLESLEDTLQSHKDLFDNVFSKYEIRPRFRFLQGEQAIYAIQFNSEFSHGRFVRDIVSLMNYLSCSIDDIVTKFMTDKHTMQRSLMIDTPQARIYQEKVNALDMDNHEIQFLDKDYGSLNSDTLMIDGKFYYFVYKDPLVVMEINNKDFYETQVMVFDQLRSSLGE